MSSPREAELLSAAGYLCNAVENLRALGLSVLADDVERCITALEVEVFLTTLARRAGR
jgi:hypothetical protein